MLRRLVPLILSYVVFLASHSLLYSVFLSWFSPTSLSAMFAFAAAVFLAWGTLFLAEKCLGVLYSEILPAPANKNTCIRYLWYGFWGLFCVNCLLSILFLDEKTGGDSAAAYIFPVLSAVVVHPAGEEILFRRLFLPRIEKYLPKNAAIIVQAILFSITHYTSGAGNMLYAFVGGFILGMVYRNTGKLYFSILLHSAVNLLGLFLSHAALPIASGITLCILCISLIYFLFSHKRKEIRS